MCIYAFSWPPSISLPPWSFETCSSSGCNEVGELTSLWWGMRSVSCSNSYCSMPTSNCSSAYSISWVKSFPYDGSLCYLNANCSNESTTCTGAVSSVYTWCAPIEYATVVLPSPVGTTLVLSRVAPSTDASPSLLLLCCTTASLPE